MRARGDVPFHMAVSEKTLGLGVVGAGSFSTFFIESCRAVDRFKVVGVYNRTSSRAVQFADRFGGSIHTSPEELAGDPAVDVVYVATTPARHAAHALPAIEAGKHVLVEKPMATSLGDADRLARAAERSNVRLGTMFIMRYSPLVAPLRRLIRERLLGGMLRGQLFNLASDEGLPDTHWFWNEAEGGGIFIEHGVHFFDLARFLFGEGSVMGARSLRRPGSDVADQVDCDVQYGEDSVVGFHHGFHQPAPLDRREWHFVFERGEVRLRGWIPSQLEITALLDEASIGRLSACLPAAGVRVLERYAGDRRFFSRRWNHEAADALVRMEWNLAAGAKELYATALAELATDFAQWIEDPGRPARATGEDGREALALAVAASDLAKRRTA
jgi:predicted dehydrogenase